MADRLKDIIRAFAWTHVLVAILATCAYRYFTLDQSALLNKRDAIVEGGTQIGALKQKIEEAKKFELEFEQRKKKYAEIVRQFQLVQGALPKQFSLPDVLNDLIQETKLVDLEVLNVIPDGREEKKELYSTLGVAIEARGSFLQLLVLLDRLASVKRLIGVTSISLVREGPNTSIVDAENKTVEYPLLKTRLKLVAYRYGGSG